MAETLSAPHLDKATAVSAIVTLMDKAYIRVGSEKFAQRKEEWVSGPSGKKQKKEPSFGASSLRKDQVTVEGDTVRVQFKGKSHKDWDRAVTDPALAKSVKTFLKGPGDRLFEYKDQSGKSTAVTERDVREYVATFGGQPKDFRTYHANRLLAEELAKLPKPTTSGVAEKNLSAAIAKVAVQLGHTAAIDRKSYQDPARMKAYVESATSPR